MTSYTEKKFRHKRTMQDYVKKLGDKYTNDPKMYTIINSNGNIRYVLLSPKK